MKSMIKIIVRYIASAAGIALILLCVNVTALAVWTYHAEKMAGHNYKISQITDCLVKQNDNFILSEKGKKIIDEQYDWAMLLDEKGSVIWSENLPDDVPLNYTASDIASFTRWYLNDYPVNVWKHPQGLLVLASPRNSLWKYGIEMQQTVLNSILSWIPGVLVLNVIAAVLLALLFSFRLFRSLQPIAGGIEDISANKPVTLSTSGILGDLAAKLNQTSEHLKLQETALKKRDCARTTWIAGVSHDIRTPLSIVMGYSSQLEENPEMPEEQREKAGIIRKQSEKIKALVSNLNLASKLEYDMQPINVKRLFPAAIIRSVVTYFLNSGLGDCYFIDITIQNDAQSAAITGDEELLQRAVSNLVTNSIAHNPKGCSITVSLKKESTFCVIKVTDNGIGFPHKILDGINNTDNVAELQSHGLGLTIVRQIAKAHGGSAEFYNLPQKGCAAVIKLPIANMP